jgi:cellulose 1,4-beta-cellobiosidase
MARLITIVGLLALASCAAGVDSQSGGGGGGGGDTGSGSSGTSGGDGGGAGGDGSASSVTIPTGGNPFTDAVGYVNPDYVAEVETSVAAHPDQATLLHKVEAIPNAIWLDSIAKVAKVTGYLDDALAHQTSTAIVTTFVIYDLPDRDCAALASNGELTVANDGVDQYESQFIDPIAAAFAAHPNQRIVAIIEPDSLGNLATNLSVPKCAAAQAAYLESVEYAINKLSMPNTFLYIDAAHAGWLGWPNNTTAIATIFQQVLSAAGGNDKVRGFITDVANYTVLDATTELFDYQGNPCHDEYTYVQHLADALSAAGITDKGYLIDTSRNGKGGIRHDWGAWCNVAGAALGERPAASPRPGLDAYIWIKPPGESDGTSDSTAPRFDAHCASVDSMIGAPQAGQWFDTYLLSVAQNAIPAL